VTAVVDTHQHFWELTRQAQPWHTPAHGAIAADFGPADLDPARRRCGVDATVLVQSVDTPEENDRLRAYAAEAGFVAGVVAWLPLTDPPRARQELARIRRRHGGEGSAGGRLCGVRCLVGREPLDALERAEALAVLDELAEAGLTWDVVPVTEEQRASVARIARAVPALRVIVDHLARPPLEPAGWHPWTEQLQHLAACPNVALKVSVGIDVLTAWPAWDPAILARWVDTAVRVFGPRRLMLASNWPVVLLRATYPQAWGDLTAALVDAGAGTADLTQIRGGTAERWYGLGGAR
jgi:L-fuconolactonase